MDAEGAGGPSSCGGPSTPYWPHGAGVQSRWGHGPQEGGTQEGPSPCPGMERLWSSQAGWRGCYEPLRLTDRWVVKTSGLSGPPPLRAPRPCRLGHRKDLRHCGPVTRSSDQKSVVYLVYASVSPL